MRETHLWAQTRDTGRAVAAPSCTSGWEPEKSHTSFKRCRKCLLVAWHPYTAHACNPIEIMHACDDADGCARREGVARQRAALEVQQPGAQHDAAAHDGEEVQVQRGCKVARTSQGGGLT